MGSLEACLARGEDEIREAQQLRYKIFYEECGAVPDAWTALKRLDADKYDEHCDHLVVLDHACSQSRDQGRPKIVGAYRLLPGDRAGRAGGFYSANEYDMGPLLMRHADKRILELGRSCVIESYRHKRTIETLWCGLLAYIRAHQVDVVMGCASFPGAVPDVHAEALSYLAYYAGAKGEWRVQARPDRYWPMELIPRGSLDERSARDSLPPLIKGYLRLGACFGDGAVADAKFNTTDVFVVMPVDRIGMRYIRHFGGRGAI
jgi:putative hemolysin